MVDNQKPSTNKELYADLSPEEREAAEYNLERYFELVWRIYERVRKEDPIALQEAIERALVNE